MDHARERVTNMPFCRRINIPDPGSEEVEVVYQSMKAEIDTATKEYINRNCDSKGNLKTSNIDKETRDGIRSLRRRVKSGELLIQMTDKSGKLCANTKENYVASLQPHIENDSVITLKEKIKTENNLNAHCVQLARILRIGESHGHESRVRSAVTNRSCHVPVLSAMLKDHKPVPPGRPLPVRPVCGADEANNQQLSQILAGIVTAVTEIMDKEIKSTCRSTEEMCHAIEEVNKMTNIKDLVIFSTDVSGMYPALDIPVCARVAAEMWDESGLELNLNHEELSLYLAVTVDKEKLTSLGLREVTHSRIASRGARPGITTKEILSRDSKTKSLFHKPEREPSREETRVMFKLAFEILLNEAMEEHMYSFNGEMRKQAAGGAIGNILTGSLAVCFMVRWCKIFRGKVLSATRTIPGFRLYMQKIYVDDKNIACEGLPPGSRYKEGKVEVVESEVEDDKLIPSDIRTSKILLEIGNSISNFIQLTSDCPSQNTSGFMPILDLQVKTVENQIIYKFYKKEVANKLLILKSSAMPFQVKRASLSQEVLRRLRNTRRDLPWSEKAEILSEFSHKLMCSGWTERHRYDFIMAGLTGYRRQLENSDAGITPLYRPREWDRETRRRKKLMARTAWYRPADAVMFVPATPGSELRNSIQEIVTRKTAEIGMTATVKETGGTKMRDSLVRLDLTGCTYPQCRACKSDLGGASHTRSGVHYLITCKACEANRTSAIYHGESGFNGVHRLGEHESAIKNKDTRNALAKHLALHHPDRVGDPDVFDYKVLQTFKKCLEREVSEGVALTFSKADIIMNQKSEHHQPAVHRAVMTRELQHGS